MIWKWLGAVLIGAACFGFAIMIAMFHKKEIETLKGLICALNYMECELQYRMPPLPQLCKNTAKECSGCLQKVFLKLSMELEEQISPDVRHCMKYVLSQSKDIPNETKQGLLLLGDSLGRFDLNGQLSALASVNRECNYRLEKLMGNSDARLRSYQTLGLCGGAALIILLM